MASAISFNGVVIRLTDERWYHISVNHPEMSAYYFEILETISSPEVVYEGKDNALIATKSLEDKGLKMIVVIYKETDSSDGFVITSYTSNKISELQKRKVIWKLQH